MTITLTFTTSDEVTKVKRELEKQGFIQTGNAYWTRILKKR